MNQYHKADHIVGDVSFSIPQRKKLKLEWIGCSVDFERRGLRAVRGDGAIEFGCGWKDLGMLISYGFLQLLDFWQLLNCSV